jgi:membrane protein DedA with SNARE-associated domain
MQIVPDSSLINLLYTHRYIFSFLGALFEGTFIMLLTGVFYKLGVFNFWGLMAVLMAGYFLNGIGLYLIGRYGGNKIMEWLKKFYLTKGITGKLEEYFKIHSVKMLFITRLTYGLSAPAFLIAGSFKMNFKKFIIISLIATIVWVSALVGIGYGFGASYKALSLVTKGIKFGLTISLFIGLGLIALLIVYGMRWFTRTKFIKDLSEQKESQLLRWLGEKISNLGKK